MYIVYLDKGASGSLVPRLPSFFGGYANFPAFSAAFV